MRDYGVTSRLSRVRAAGGPPTRSGAQNLKVAGLSGRPNMTHCWITSLFWVETKAAPGGPRRRRRGARGVVGGDGGGSGAKRNMAPLTGITVARGPGGGGGAGSRYQTSPQTEPEPDGWYRKARSLGSALLIARAPPPLPPPPLPLPCAGHLLEGTGGPALCKHPVYRGG